MLNSLEIRNYQSHKHSVLNFHKGLNVITGTSDSGKSTIIRSMLWALNNRPSGEAFKSWFSKTEDIVDVAMEFDNDYFTKSRIKGKNSYETETDTYEALRSDVPEEVSKIANISDYNIQTQFQPYFLLQDSPGERAKQLNELVGLSIIDSIFKKLNGKIQTTKTNVKQTETEVLRLRGELSKFENLHSIELMIEKLYSDIQTAEQTAERAGSVRLSIGSINEINSLIAEKSKILKSEASYLNLMQKVSDRSHLSVRINAIKSDLEDLLNVEEVLAEDKEWLKIEKCSGNLSLLVKEANAYREKIKTISNLLNDIGYLDEQIDKNLKEMEDKISEYAELLKNSGMCPTCYGTVDSKVTKKIVDKLRREHGSEVG